MPTPKRAQENKIKNVKNAISRVESAKKGYSEIQQYIVKQYERKVCLKSVIEDKKAKVDNRISQTYRNTEQNNPR